MILKTRQLDITLEFLFLFVFTSAGNLVFFVLCVMQSRLQ